MVEGLNVRGRSPERKEKGYKGRNQSRSKSRTKKTCWNCKKEGHFRRNFPQRKSCQKTDTNPGSDEVNLLEGYEETEVLTISIDDPKEE